MVVGIKPAEPARIGGVLETVHGLADLAQPIAQQAFLLPLYLDTRQGSAMVERIIKIAKATINSTK